MSRKTYIWDKETESFIEIGKKLVKEAVAPGIQTDTMERSWNHATCQWHDSKSEMKKRAEAKGWVDASEYSDEYLAKRKASVERERDAKHRQAIRADIFKALNETGH